MNRLIILAWILVATATVQAQIIRVPADYPTIQEGINAANDGDTVLVSPGTYLENITIDLKSIIVASLYLTTGDEAYISQTVIDGNQNGSVVTIHNSDYDDYVPSLIGFTIINGNGGYEGGGIRVSYASPRLEHMVIKNNQAEYGGGIYCTDSDLHMEQVLIANNISSYGGGFYFQYSEPSLASITISGNSATYEGGGIIFDESQPLFDAQNRCNILNNHAASGMDLKYSTWSGYSGQVVMVLDTFSVLHPTEFYASPLEYFTFDILNGKIEQVMTDLYVSPSGDDANSGLNSGEPLKTIYHAYAIIYPDSLNPLKIHLADGTYSPSQTGEIYPLQMLDYITLEGDSETGVILDAEESSGVISIDQNLSTGLSNLTITGGNSSAGGGIYCYSSNPVFKNILLAGNTASNGGGMCLANSNPYMQNITIKNNTASYQGGGINFYGSSSPVFDTLDRCNIYFNEAPTGKDLYSYSYNSNKINIVLDTFTVLTPKSVFSYPLDYYSFDILNGKLPQENITLYVSPSGDDANSGHSTGDPLKTISYALSVASTDTLDFYKIHLMSGIYSSILEWGYFPSKHSGMFDTGRRI